MKSQNFFQFEPNVSSLRFKNLQQASFNPEPSSTQTSGRGFRNRTWVFSRCADTQTLKTTEGTVKPALLGKLSFGKPMSPPRFGNASSLLPAGVLLGGARPGFPQQRRAEDADDGQVEGDADGERPDGPQEGWHRPVELEPRPPGRHVRDHALHLEVGSHHSADVEQLVAVA